MRRIEGWDRFISRPVIPVTKQFDVAVTAFRTRDHERWLPIKKFCGCHFNSSDIETAQGTGVPVIETSCYVKLVSDGRVRLMSCGYDRAAHGDNGICDLLIARAHQLRQLLANS